MSDWSNAQREMDTDANGRMYSGVSSDALEGEEMVVGAYSPRGKNTAEALAIEEEHEFASSDNNEPGGEAVKKQQVTGSESGDSPPEGERSCFENAIHILSNVIPAGGMLSAAFNLASTSIGAGIMGLPGAFNSTGYAMAAVYLILVTAETAYSMRMLAIVAEKSGLMTMEEMMRGLISPSGNFIVALLRFLHSFGACVAFVVTTGDLLTPILTNASGTPEYLLSTSGTRVLQTVLWAVFFLPVSIPRKINSLRYVSLVGLAFILFFCVCVIVHSCMSGLQADPRPEVKAFNTGNKAIEGMGVFVFSYMCQVSVGPILREGTLSVRKFTVSCVISMTVCGILYFLVGLFGYLDFGDEVTGSVLLRYDPLSEYQFLVCYIGIFIKICASYGLLGYSCRDAIYQVIGWSPEEVAFWKHLILSVVVAGCSLLCGLFIPNVNMVFGFIGGLCGGSLGFVLPALYYMYSGNWTLKSVGPINYVCTLLTLIGGVVAIVWGTAAAIYSAA